VSSEDGKTGRVPYYLDRRPQLFAWRGEAIVDAPQEDVEVAVGYHAWTDKGPTIDGRRLTLLARKRSYRTGEEVRVVHVVESTRADDFLYVAGPKKVYGEFVDGQSATPLPPNDIDPLVPLDYDGPMIPSPVVDYNYEVTAYVFAEPGAHEIRWKLGVLESNTLKIFVTDVK
jgi:hypothetical protein